MNEREVRTAPSINGHIITLGPGHSIAIYERNHECYVAEFRDGDGTLEYAGSWFRFHAGGLRYLHNRRAAFQFSMPLTQEMLEQIEQLHAQSEVRQETMLAVPRRVAAAVQAYLISVISRLRCGGSKISRRPG